MKLLLHTCCAPCSIYPLKSLRQEGYTPTLFWYNPNIHPFSEYTARRDCLKKYAASQRAELIIEDLYGLDAFTCAVADDLANRCQNYCYPRRLRRTFEYARQHHYDAVSTTLLYSIYQKHDIIKELMEKLSSEYNIKFLYRDWREGWSEGQAAARTAELYMQKYCGCIFSEEEANIGREFRKDLRRAGVRGDDAALRKIIKASSKEKEVDLTQIKSAIA